jgi:hypothetical protein
MEWLSCLLYKGEPDQNRPLPSKKVPEEIVDFIFQQIQDDVKRLVESNHQMGKCNLSRDDLCSRKAIYMSLCDLAGRGKNGRNNV